MGDPALQQFAQSHKSDPYMVSLALNESNRRKAVRNAKQAQGGAPQGKVVDQSIAGMSPTPVMTGAGVPLQTGYGGHVQTELPENQGIGRLPAPNMRHMADGGIAGYPDDVEFMSGGGVPGYADFGSVSQPFEAAFQKTLGYEGGYVEDDAGKGESNFGINKSANPDVDVKGLTKDQARALYKKRYWDAIGGDDLAAKNPALATVAFDTAVNMGVSKANQLVAQSKGDPSALLGMRQQHYDKLIENNPKKFAPYAKGWKDRVADLATSIIPSAEAGELPTAKAPVQPEKTGLATTDAGRYTGAGMAGTTTGLAGLQSLRDAFTAGFKPGTTAGQAGRARGLAAAVPQAVLQGGSAATDLAGNNLKLMSGDVGRKLTANPMLSAMSGDTGFAAAIMDAAENNPKGPSTMPYSEQMANVAKMFIGHPDISKQRIANEKAAADKAQAKKPMVKADPNVYDREDMEEGAAKFELPEPDKIVKAAKEATPAKERKGFDDEDMLTLGLQLLAGKNPKFLGALGEAGLGTLAAKKAREKAETEKELVQAHREYYTGAGKKAEAEAKNTEAGTKYNAAARQHAMDNIAREMQKWMQSLGGLNPTPQEEEAKRSSLVRYYYPLAGLEIPSTMNTPPPNSQIKVLGSRPQ
jgi:hypothetical protein